EGSKLTFLASSFEVSPPNRNTPFATWYELTRFRLVGDGKAPPLREREVRLEGHDGKEFEFDAGARGKLAGRLFHGKGSGGGQRLVCLVVRGRAAALAAPDVRKYLDSLRLLREETPVSADPHRTLKAHPGPVADVAYSPDGKTLAVGLRGGEIRLFDA